MSQQWIDAILVQRTYIEMLKATSTPVSVADLAAELFRRGMKNPQSGAAPHRSTVYDILSTTPIGQKLLAENMRRKRAGRQRAAISSDETKPDGSSSPALSGQPDGAESGASDDVG